MHVAFVFMHENYHENYHCEIRATGVNGEMIYGDLRPAPENGGWVFYLREVPGAMRWMHSNARAKSCSAKVGLFSIVTNNAAVR